MRKFLLPAVCSLFLWNCNEQLPVNQDQDDGKGNTQNADGIEVGGPIEIEPGDLSVIKKAHALSKASGLRIKNANAQEILAKYLAKALAASLSDPEVRKAVKVEVGAAFDGDFNVLWSKIKGKPTKGGDFQSKIRQKFSSNALSTGIMEMFDDFRRLQIAIPKNFDKWDGTQPLLVACVPFTKDDLNTDFIYAYDVGQKEYQLDGKKAPDFPVVVIGKNERTNNNEELLGGIFVDAGNGTLVPTDAIPAAPIGGNGSNPFGEVKFGYPADKSAVGPAPLKKKAAAAFAVTPKVPLYWDKIIVYTDLEGWFMGGMEIRMHLLSDKEVALTAQKEGVYEDNNYNVGSFLRNINEDIARYIGTKFTEIDDNDWDKNFTFKLSADIAKIMKGVDSNGIINGDIGYNFGGDTDDDAVGENNKIELGSQDVGTYWTNGVAKVKFKYDPGIVEYDVSAMPYVSAGGNQGRGNSWDLSDAYGNNVDDGEDVTYRLIVPQNETNTYRISTCDAMTNFDTMLQIFDKDRGTPYVNDDDYSCPNNIRHSTMTAQLSAGTYYIVVDGWAGFVGSYRLSVQKI